MVSNMEAVKQNTVIDGNVSAPTAPEERCRMDTVPCHVYFIVLRTIY